MLQKVVDVLYFLFGDYEKKKEEENYNILFNKDKFIGILSKSQIGLYNAGGSCYMASIIQINSFSLFSILIVKFIILS